MSTAAKLLAHAPDHRAHLFVFAKVGLEQDRPGCAGANFLQGSPGGLFVAAVVERQRCATAS
jgi:hypothetical protein